jgi:acetolactate synthase-1/2/3 large subunit
VIVATLKISDAIFAKLSSLGIKQIFSVTGGASMHLNVSAAESRKFSIMYMHNEQSCSMAAEGYARISHIPALVIATAGPGAINTLNGVFGAFTDSIPMLVITGQSRKNTQKSNFGLDNLRQLGDQEAPMLDMVKRITKQQFEITEVHTAREIIELLELAFISSTSDRPGPVWIEVPVDVQGQIKEFTDSDLLAEIKLPDKKKIELPINSLNTLVEKILSAKKPVLMLGSGVLISKSELKAIEFSEKMNIPIITAWAHDIIRSDHPMFMGRSGTIGSRPGNLVVQQADLLIVVGSRLNIRQISYNYDSFAKDAFKIHVDIDEFELNKPFPITDLKIQSDALDFFNTVLNIEFNFENKEKFTNWVEWCREVNMKYSISERDYPVKNDVINPYHLIPEIFKLAEANTIFVCGDATACIVPFQTANIKSGMNMFSNSGCASMGYDLPAAIGAALAAPERPVVCFAGDGSIMMNLQELQTLSDLTSKFTLIILENGGYLSIKQTQSNFFDNYYGSTSESGLSFPDFEKVAMAFGLNTISLNPKKWRSELKENYLALRKKVIIAHLDREQEIEPRIKSRIIDNLIQTPQLDDMYPHLKTEELIELRDSARF